MILDDAVEDIGTKVRAEDALQKRDGCRGSTEREKVLGTLVHKLACAQDLPKGSASQAQRSLDDLQVKLKKEGVNETLVDRVFQYLNRFYVNHKKKTLQSRHRKIRAVLWMGACTREH